MTDTNTPDLVHEAKPVIIVIFGITGDLADKKLLPALYHLFKDGLLHEDSVILGISRKNMTSEDLLGQVQLCVNEVDQVCDPDGVRKMHQALRMHQMSQTDAAEYDQLLHILNDIENEKGVCMNRLYYLSIPPQTYELIVRNLGEHGHNGSCQHGNAETMLLVEKPFGYNTASAETLIAETGKWFKEDQQFRIDHYVAKETVQNILEFRRFNPVFGAIWNRNHIASIEITAFEKITIEDRTVFYEGVGALRDFIQSHLLQLLTVVTMELPEVHGSPAVHAAKQVLLQSVHHIQPDEVASRAVRGQYDSYRHEVNNPESNTETYASLSLSVENDRWRGVPMTIRTGKAMAHKLTEISIVFRNTQTESAVSNELVFTIQPSEGISLRLNAKKPGYAHELQTVVMDFHYQQTYAGANKTGQSSYPTMVGGPDAYERVLVDAIRGDHTLFTTSEEVLSAWRIVENVLDAWSKSGEGLIIYANGSESVGE